MNKILRISLKGILTVLVLLFAFSFGTPPVHASTGYLTLNLTTPTDGSNNEPYTFVRQFNIQWVDQYPNCGPGGCYYSSGANNTTLTWGISGCPTGATCTLSPTNGTGSEYIGGSTYNVSDVSVIPAPILYTPRVTIIPGSNTPSGTYTIYFTVFEYDYRGARSCQSSDYGQSCLAQVIKSINITIPPPPTVTIKANNQTGSATISYNSGATITWTSTNATGCTTSPSIGSGTSNTTGVSTGNLTSSQRYNITCTGPRGTATSYVDVNPNPPPSTADIKANSSDSPTAIAYNSSATLSWTSTNATGCTTSPNVGSGVSNSGVSTGNLTTTTTYTLSCTGSGGNSTDTVRVTVLPQPPAVSIKANNTNPAQITYNTGATLSWTSTNASSCLVTPGGWTDLSNAGVSTGNLTSSKTYSISCTGPGGTTSDNVSVNVGTLPLPTVNIQANPTTVAYNGSATLTWSSTDAATCSVTPGGWTDKLNTSGVSTGSLTSQKTYTITCTNQTGSASASTVVNVTQQSAPVVTLSASPQSGTDPFNSTLTWSTTNNPDSCTASNGWSGSKASTGGSQTLNGIQNTATYTLTCTNSGGSGSASVTITAAPSCVLPSSRSTPTISGPSSANVNTSFEIGCDYGSALDYVSAPTDCAYTRHDGTNTIFTCTAPSTAQTKTYSCNTSNVPGFTNWCSIPSSFLISKQVTIVGPLAPTVSIKANDQTGSVSVPYNTGATITWTSTNATQCGMSPNIGNSTSNTTGVSTGNLTSSQTYSITCNNGAGDSVSSSVTVNPGAVPNTAPVAPTITGASTGTTGINYSFTLTSTDSESDQIRYGIDWNMDGVADVWLPANNAYVPSGTSQTITQSWSTTGTKTFQVLAQDAPGLNSGWTTHSITISSIVTVLSPAVTINASPSSGASPLTTTLSWNVTNNPDSCTASNGWSGAKSTTGGQTISGITTTTTYTLTCTNSAGSNTSSITVTPTAQGSLYSLSVIKTYGGSVKTGDSLIDCGATCSISYPAGSNVTLTAYPDSAQWKFIGWQGACTGTGSCMVNVNGAKTVTAQFALKPLIYQEF